MTAPSRPPIVCLIGSRQAKEGYELALRQETLAGKIVLVGGYTYAERGLYDNAPLMVHEDFRAPGAKEVVEGLLLHKIAMADEVLVVNQGGYVGETCRKEIEYARQQGKPLRYLYRLLEPEVG